MILEQYISPSVQVTTKVDPTDCQSKGFGSTGVNNDSMLPDITRQTKYNLKQMKLPNRMLSKIKPTP